MGGSSIPVTVIIELQTKLWKAVESKDWDECPPLVKKILAQLKLALNPQTSKTGKKVHLDGVLRLGTMYYERAPGYAKKELNKMNRIIKAAERSVE